MEEFQTLGNLLNRLPGQRIIGLFKPCAYLVSGLSEIIVARRDCSYLETWWSPWGGLHSDSNRRRERSRHKYVGFSLYCPKELGLAGPVPVREVLDKILEKYPDALGPKTTWFYWLARGLTVNLNYEI